MSFIGKRRITGSQYALIVLAHCAECFSFFEPAWWELTYCDAYTANVTQLAASTARARHSVAAKQTASERSQLFQLAAVGRLTAEARVPRHVERNGLVVSGRNERARIGRQRSFVGLVLAEPEPVMSAVIAAEQR